jgi:hypothetical protein
MKSDQKEERKSETSSGGFFGIFQKKKEKDQSDLSKSAVSKSSINDSASSFQSRTSSTGSM